MRIGIDFDNTIICYDQVFCELAKSWQLVNADYQGTKKELRDYIRHLPEGDIIWQHLQGKAYGQFIHQAKMFTGFKDFLAACQNRPNVEVFIVSHKTELGHFDEDCVNLRDAARKWLTQQGIFDCNAPSILEKNVFFETTREEKIERIKTINCTHFIDDLIEVLYSPSFPENVERFLFQPEADHERSTIKHYSNWAELKHAFFI